MLRIVFVFIGLLLSISAFAANYCLDCDRGIAASKTYCTNCQNKRDRANQKMVQRILNGGQKPTSSSEKRKIQIAAAKYLKEKYSRYFSVDASEIVVKRTFTYNGGASGAELTFDCTVRGSDKQAKIKMVKKGSVWKVDECKFFDR